MTDSPLYYFTKTDVLLAEIKMLETLLPNTTEDVYTFTVNRIRAVADLVALAEGQTFYPRLVAPVEEFK